MARGPDQVGSSGMERRAGCFPAAIHWQAALEACWLHISNCREKRVDYIRAAHVLAGLISLPPFGISPARCAGHVHSQKIIPRK